MVRKSNEQRPARTPAEDVETIEAIQRGMRDADEGRVTPIEAVRKSVSKWTSKSSSPTKR